MLPTHRAGDELTAREVYDIWRLRDVVFAVEQQYGDVEVDGLDLLPTTSHLWFADFAGLTSYLRLWLGDDGGWHLGRVCTRRDQRGRGLASQLIGHAHQLWPAPIQISAQLYLENWYTGFGYTRSGEVFDDGGIPHVPMALDGD